MCDLTSIDYQKGDVVWVKLSNLWWPGLVQDYDGLPEEIKTDFKKPPIAVVKFFQEESFEYVKNTNNIYHYNCLKKNEFIKKGLEMMRSTRVSSSNMQMFPCDIVTAENLTNGNPKILDEPEFQMKDEQDVGKAIYEDLFSTPNNKKSKKNKKENLNSSIISSAKTSPLVIIGNSNKKEKRKVLSKQKFEEIDPKFNIILAEAFEHYSSKELIQPANNENDMELDIRCVDCNYICKRVNVMALHYRAHARNYDHKIKYPTGEKRKKKYWSTSVSSKKMKIVNGSDNKNGKSKSNRVAAVGGNSGDKNKILETATKEDVEKLKMEFLNDWEEDDDDDNIKDYVAMLNDDMDDSNETTLDSQNLDETESEINKPDEIIKEDEKISCFDFDDNEDETSNNTTTNKNIPFSKIRKNSKSEDSNKERHAMKDSTHTTSVGTNNDKNTLGIGRRKSIKNDLSDEIDNLLNETKMIEIPFIDNKNKTDSKDGRTRKSIGSDIDVEPNSTINKDDMNSNFGQLEDENLNESVNFRHDIQLKTCSTPNVSTRTNMTTRRSSVGKATATRGANVSALTTPSSNNKLSKQTLKRNYFKKVREEIAEIAKFEDEDEKEHQDDEEEDEDDEKEEENNTIQEDKKLKEKELTTETTNLKEIENKDKGITKPETNSKESDKEIDTNKQTQDKDIKSKSITPAQTTPTKLNEISDQQDNIQTKAVDINKNQNNKDNKITPNKNDNNKTNDNIQPNAETINEPAEPNEKIVRIGNQNIHVPIRRNSKYIEQPSPNKINKTENDIGISSGASSGGGIIRKTDKHKTEDEISNMIIIEELGVQQQSKVITQTPTPTIITPTKTVIIDKNIIPPSLNKKNPPTSSSASSTLHIDMNLANKNKTPTFTMTQKYKSVNIPTTINNPSAAASLVAQSSTASMSEKTIILPNNTKIKAPIKTGVLTTPNKSGASVTPIKTGTPNTTPLKNTIVLTKSDGEKIYLTETQSGEFSNKRKLTIPSTSNSKKIVKENVVKSNEIGTNQSQIVSYYVPHTGGNQGNTQTKVVNPTGGGATAIPTITMKSTQKKINMPLPGLNKLTNVPIKQKIKNINTPSNIIATNSVKMTGTTNVLQNKIKTIAHSNAIRKEINSSPSATSTTLLKQTPSTSKQNTVIVNQNTLPTILQQRKNSNEPRGQIPTIISEPIIINTCGTDPSLVGVEGGANVRANVELLSGLSVAGANLTPALTSSDSIVYLIDDEHSQQIVFNQNENNEIEANTAQTNQQQSQTIYLDTNNFYLTIDEVGNILSISDNTQHQSIDANPNAQHISDGNTITQIQLNDGNINETSVHIGGGREINEKIIIEKSTSDIIAKALADTQVLQAECIAETNNENYQQISVMEAVAAGTAAVGVVAGTVTPLVNNTYETSLTLNKAPIMSTSIAPTQINQNSSYYTLSIPNTMSTNVIPTIRNTGETLNEIKTDIRNIPSPEIEYNPSDIVPT